MLVLTRRIGEAIVIGSDIRITVTAIEGRKVRLGFNAPLQVRIEREEIHGRRETPVYVGSPTSVLDQTAGDVKVQPY